MGIMDRGKGKGKGMGDAKCQNNFENSERN